MTPVAENLDSLPNRGRVCCLSSRSIVPFLLGAQGLSWSGHGWIVGWFLFLFWKSKRDRVAME